MPPLSLAVGHASHHQPPVGRPLGALLSLSGSTPALHTAPQCGDAERGRQNKELKQEGQPFSSTV